MKSFFFRLLSFREGSSWCFLFLLYSSEAMESYTRCSLLSALYLLSNGAMESGPPSPFLFKAFTQPHLLIVHYQQTDFVTHYPPLELNFLRKFSQVIITYHFYSSSLSFNPSLFSTLFESPHTETELLHSSHISTTLQLSL